MNTSEEVLSKLESLIYQRDDVNKRKEQRLQREIGELELSLEPLSLAELHALDAIGQNTGLNVIGISRQMNMTRGAISKICARLERKGLVSKLQLPDNQKEVFFKLTLPGERVFELHRKEHGQAVERYLRILERYTPDELQLISRFLGDMLTRDE